MLQGLVGPRSDRGHDGVCHRTVGIRDSRGKQPEDLVVHARVEPPVALVQPCQLGRGVDVLSVDPAVDG